MPRRTVPPDQSCGRSGFRALALTGGATIVSLPLGIQGQPFALCASVGMPVAMRRQFAGESASTGECTQITCARLSGAILMGYTWLGAIHPAGRGRRCIPDVRGVSRPSRLGGQRTYVARRSIDGPGSVVTGSYRDRTRVRAGSATRRRIHCDGASGPSGSKLCGDCRHRFRSRTGCRTSPAMWRGSVFREAACAGRLR